MQQAKVDTSIRTVAAAAQRVAEETGNPASAIQLPDGEIVTGKTTALMGGSSATPTRWRPGPWRSWTACVGARPTPASSSHRRTRALIASWGCA